MARFGGTSGDDEVNGGDGNDRVDGLGGNDVVRGGGGRDTVTGGAGDDRVEDGAGPEVDALFGDGGNDILRADGGNDWLDGGAGNDEVDGGAGPDRMRGREGHDRLLADDGDQAWGGKDDDLLVFRPTAEYVGNDDFGGQGSGPVAQLAGNSGADAVEVDATGALINGLRPDGVLVFATDGGRFGISIETRASPEDDYSNRLVAWAEGTEAISLKADGPALHYVGNTGGATSSTVSVSATDAADEFAGGTDKETVDLRGGDDTAYLGRGGDTITLGGGADAVFLNGGSQGFVSATVTDFKGGEDRLEISGFEPGALSVTREEGVGTRLAAEGSCDVLLAGVFDDTGFDFV